MWGHLAGNSMSDNNYLSYVAIVYGFVIIIKLLPE